MAAPHPTCPPELERRFEVVEVYSGGEGWTARVRGEDGRDAVLKVLDGGQAPVESDLLASLPHIGIPRILGLGHARDGRAWLLREFVAGTAVAELRPFAVADARALAVDVLEVLAHVHLRGILHLDIKPANVVRDVRGHYRVLDFGLGVRRGEKSGGGTPFFASPEVLLGALPDHRSDLFSLGALLVHVLWRGSGPPLERFFRCFPERGFLDACGRRAEEFPQPFDQLLPRLLARQPERRFFDAQAALEFLSGGSGRPDVGLLRPDPIALHGAAIDAVLAGLARGTSLEVRGGTAAERDALAIHAACHRASVTAIVAAPDHHLLQRGNGGERVVWQVPSIGRAALLGHLETVLGLERAAADRACDCLLAQTQGSAARIGDLLVRLTEQSAIQPSGTRWVWPAADAGRLDQPVADPPEPIGGPAIREAARRGAVEQAMSLFRMAAVGVDPDRERELRSSLVEGFLLGGEPLRALPLAVDVPLLRIQALLDLGRTAAAEQALRQLDGDESASIYRDRLSAKLAYMRGDYERAVNAMLGVVERGDRIEDRITLGAMLDVAGRSEQAESELRFALDTLGPAEQPYLRAAALTNLAHALRRGGKTDESFALLEESRDILTSIGHARHAATAAQNLGVLAKDRSEWAEAVRHLRQARSLYEHVRDETGVANANATLGIVDLESGDFTAAERRLRAAAGDFRRLGTRRGEKLARVMLARALAELRRGPEARAALLAVGELDSDRLREEAAKVRDLLARADVPQPSPNPPPSEESLVASDPGISSELFRTFLAVNRRLAAETDLDRALEHLLDAAVTLTGGREGYLLVQRPDGLRREFSLGRVAGAPGRFSRSLANRAIQEQRTLTGDDAAASADLADMPSVRELQVRSAICAPFRSADGTSGAIYIGHSGRPRAFGDRDKEHLEILADQAAIAVDRKLREEQLTTQLEASRKQLAVVKRKTRREPVRMIGDSPVMVELRAQVERLADLELSVLILGETGTGKELVARAIHDHGARSRGPFVAENCSALPAELMERELFGHVAGAFTGADEDRPGLVELSDGGTLFLDEVGDMPIALQVKLLRALQERTIRRVGSTENLAVDFRLVAATHKDLKAMIAAGEFREDLYFRLAAVELKVPALRDRAGDVELLARHFLASFNREHRAVRRLTNKAVAALESYSWPGNVRELEHVIARACLLASGDVIDASHIPTGPSTPDLKPAGDSAAPGADDWPVVPLQEAERRTIEAALRSTGGEKAKAARILGISRTALYEKLKRHKQ